jgi:hypothetical protein
MNKSLLSFSVVSLCAAIGLTWNASAQNTDTPVQVSSGQWPLAEIQKNHPRLFFDQDGKRLLQLRALWTNPAYASIVNLYKNKTDAFSLALTGLATSDTDKINAAYDAAMAMPYNIAGNGADNSGIGAYCDVKALVLDWCYSYLGTPEKRALVTSLDADAGSRETAIISATRKGFSFHEAHLKGVHAYISDALAEEGEIGTNGLPVTSRLRNAQNMLQNWMSYGSAVYGDGAYKDYAYQDTAFLVPPMLFASATQTDRAKSWNYLTNRASMIARLLSQQCTAFTSGPGDQVIYNGMSGFTIAPAVLYMIAAEKKGVDNTRAGLAEWLGDLILSKQTANPTYAPWLTLLYQDNDTVNPIVKKTPTQSTAAVQWYANQGMVNFRSGWQQPEHQLPDVNAWFYAGPLGDHADCDAGDFTLSRGDDKILLRGNNYLGSPSIYKQEYQHLSFSRNTMNFAPTGLSDPDKRGSAAIAPNTQQPAGVTLPTLDEDDTAYPVASWDMFEKEDPVFNQGKITSFGGENNSLASYAVSDIAAAYNPTYVTGYQRTVVFVKPRTYIIRDTFDVNSVDRVRMLFHHPIKPTASGLTPEPGSSATAGILTGVQNTYTVTVGSSTAKVQILTPSSPTLHLVGGGNQTNGTGFEAFIDGVNQSGFTTAQIWIQNDAAEIQSRMQYVLGQWRSEFETTPAASNGVMMAVVTVDATGATLPIINFFTQSNVQHVTVGSVDIGFPSSGIPTLNGGSF